MQAHNNTVNPMYLIDSKSQIKKFEKFRTNFEIAYNGPLWKITKI